MESCDRGAPAPPAPEVRADGRLRADRSGALLRHMPQLDALRAIAVVLVFLQHLLAVPIGYRLPWGRLGVRLFFVLSGFLITGILLRCRTLVEAGNQTRGFTLRRFYVRRLLRLMPAYYAILAVAAVAGIRAIRQPLAWHLAYLSNVYFGRIHEMNAPAVHLWSLAVEEQFYLVWPWLILLVPRRMLMPVTITALALGPAYRLAATFLFHWHGPAIGLQTPACLDTLAIGALLALWSAPGFQSPASHAARDRLCQLGLWIGLPATLVAFWLLGTGRITPALDAWVDLAFGLLAAWLVGRAAIGFHGWAGRALASAPLRYAGRISYGLYLYHLFVLWAVYAMAHRLGLRTAASRHPVAMFAIISLITFLAAVASWHCFEEPILRLKRLAGYVRRSPIRAGDRPPGSPNHDRYAHALANAPSAADITLSNASTPSADGD